MNKFDSNDPKWTAFALGELATDEAAPFEAILAEDEEAQTFVTEIRAMGALLETQLEAEPMPELTDTQRAAIEQPETRRKGGKVIPFRWVFAGGAGLAAAAAALFAITGTFSADSPADPGEMSFAAVEEAEESEKSADGQRARDGEGLMGAPDDGVTSPDPPVANSQPKPTVPVTTTPRQEASEQLKSLGYLADGNSARPSGEVWGPNTPSGPTDARGLQGLGLRGTGRGGGGGKLGSIGGLGVGKAGKGKGRFAGNRRGRGSSGFGVGVAPVETVVTGDEYAPIDENKWKVARAEPLSTFSVDVDTASYANVRRMLMQRGQRPPVDAVRIEEMINYFDYDYPQPKGDDPFAVATEVAPSPWNPGRKIVRVGLQGKDIQRDERPSSNLVFLIDVSGSMASDNKLGLLKRGLGLMVEGLDQRDRVAIVVYAGASGLVLQSTSGARKADIMSALDRLKAGGSTNGGAGIELAYDVARRNFIQGGTNRVILCTDGDFNVGVTNRGGLVQLAKHKAKSGVFLTVLGLGMGNYKDATLEQIANKANGAYFLLDTDREARKVLVDELSGTLVTIAKDVKIQVEFNPARVEQYRLIGYENRKLAHRDFNDDKKDAGEIGAGHTVTALYEIVPVGGARAGVDPLRYQQPAGGNLTPEAASGELMTLKLRYKQPQGSRSKLLVYRVEDSDQTLDEASAELKFAAAVAGFGMLLRNSPNAENLDWGTVLEWADVGRRHRDPHFLRKEFVQMVRKARSLPASPGASKYRPF